MSIDKLELEHPPFTVYAHLCLPKCNVLELSIVHMDACVIEEVLIVHPISVS